MTDITRTELDSSNLHSAGHDPETRNLDIQFWDGRGDDRKPGSVYQYFDVPEEIHKALMDSDSPGKFFHRNIKGVYRFQNISD